MTVTPLMLITIAVFNVVVNHFLVNYINNHVTYPESYSALSILSIILSLSTLGLGISAFVMMIGII